MLKVIQLWSINLFPIVLLFYRTYTPEDIDEVSPVHYPSMQKAIIERKVTSWLNYDQEAYIKYELYSYDHEPSDFGVPHKVVVGPNGARAWDESGELVAEESMGVDYYEPLYDNVVQSMMNDSPERGSSLPTVSEDKIDEFEEMGFTHQVDQGMHIFSTPDVVFKYDTANLKHETLYYGEGEVLTRSQTQYFRAEPRWDILFCFRNQQEIWNRLGWPLLY
ncbi:MAG: hypothetical protein U5L96_18175 [Owenweeksia sp.]|nr:hypothetical protein [Owenweeksia sp.]